PEQIRGVRDIDARADIYSLGATFFQLVTGHAPYEGTSGAMIMSMHLTHPLPDPRTYVPELSEGVCRVLRKMMAKDRDERYRDAHPPARDLYKPQIGEPPQPLEPTASAIATFVSAEVEPAHASPPPSAARGPQPSRGHSEPSRAPAEPQAAAATPAPPGAAGPPPPAFRREDLHVDEVAVAGQIAPRAKVL